MDYPEVFSPLSTGLHGSTASQDCRDPGGITCTKCTPSGKLFFNARGRKQGPTLL